RDQTVAEALDVGDVQAQPRQPADEAGHFGLAHLDHGVAAGNDGHGALVEIVESFVFIDGRFFINLGANQFRGVSATLHGNLCQAWQTLQTHEVADGVDVGVLANSQVVVGGHAASTVDLDAR